MFVYADPVSYWDHRKPVHRTRAVDDLFDLGLDHALGADPVLGADPAVRAGAEIRGRGGTLLTDYWADGLRTFQGWASHGFPNLVHLGVG